MLLPGQWSTDAINYVKISMLPKKNYYRVVVYEKLLKNCGVIKNLLFQSTTKGSREEIKKIIVMGKITLNNFVCDTIKVMQFYVH